MGGLWSLEGLACDRGQLCSGWLLRRAWCVCSCVCNRSAAAVCGTFQRFDVRENFQNTGVRQLNFSLESILVVPSQIESLKSVLSVKLFLLNRTTDWMVRQTCSFVGRAYSTRSISFIVWFLWTIPTIWLLMLSFTKKKHSSVFTTPPDYAARLQDTKQANKHTSNSAVS